MKKSTLSLLVAAIVMTSACKKETVFVDTPYAELSAKWKEHRKEDGIRGNVKSHTKTEYTNGTLTPDGKISGGYPVKKNEIIYDENGFRENQKESKYFASEFKRDTDQYGKDVIVITKIKEQLMFGRDDERDFRNRTLVKNMKLRDVLVYATDKYGPRRIYNGAPGDTVWLDQVDDATELIYEQDSILVQSTYSYDDANRTANVTTIAWKSMSPIIDTMENVYKLNDYYQIDEEDSRTISYNTMLNKKIETKGVLVEKVVVERDAIGNITNEYTHMFPDTENAYYSYIIHEYVFY